MDSLLKYILKVFSITKKKAFFFTILNDTQEHVRYDRAFLWKANKRLPKLLGASGTTSVGKASPLLIRMRTLIRNLKEKEKVHVLHIESFEHQRKRWKRYCQDPLRPHVVWVPLKAWGRLRLGLWLERWGEKEWTDEDLEKLNTLSVCYGAALEKFTSRFSWGWFKNRFVLSFIILFILLLLMVRIPLRVVGSCEVVSEDPVRVGAPLDGVIQTVDVKPGEDVDKGTILFTYDKTIALNELYVAQKQVDIARAELHRLTVESLTQGSMTKEEREELLLKIRAQELELKKEQIKLDLAQHNADLLEVQAPIEGVVSMQNPDKWSGKAVIKGEEVMMINNPSQTIVKIWLPEDDLVPLDPEKRAEVFLHIRPEKKMTAQIFYISDKTVLTDKGISSFIVEASWDPPLEQQPKLGLKGTAVLYGENVSLFYWIIRRPWATMRRFLGV